MPTSVLIVDDHEVVRQGLRAVLEDAGGFVLAGEARTSSEAIEKARALKPDVAIIDLSLPGTSGLHLMRLISERLPDTRMLVLSMHFDDAYVTEALRLGATGYIVKGAPSAEIVEGVRVVADGGNYFSSGVSPDAIAIATGARNDVKSSFASLSDREVDVLSLIAEGKTSKQIGEALDIGARTVETHRVHMLRKLGLKSSTDLYGYAIKHALLIRRR
jgi:DNA-binding NarL/FixJ family response regulator